MIRTMGLLVVVAGLSLSACGSRENKAPAPAATPTFTPAPDDQALVGSWSDGTTTMTLRANKTYTMEMTRPGRNATTSAGKWSLRGGALYLHPEGATDEVYDFQWGAEQRSLNMSSAKGGAWNLSKR